MSEFESIGAVVGRIIKKIERQIENRAPKSEVIDMKTRQPFRIEQAKPGDDADKVKAIVQHCEDTIFAAAVTIRAAAGLGASLKALGDTATELRNQTP